MLLCTTHRPPRLAELVLVAFCGAWGTSAAAQTPFIDASIFATPVGVGNGPTPEGEVTITREKSFSSTPPDMTNSGLALTAADATRDGRFSQVLFVRSGPVVDNSRNPETEGRLVFPAGLTVIGTVSEIGRAHV